MKFIKITVLLVVVLVSFQCKKNTTSTQKETIIIEDVLGER